MKRALDILFALTHPAHWIRTKEANAEWDRVLNRLLDYYQPENVGPLGDQARIGNVTVWTGNYPYSYGEPYIDDDRKLGALPFRRTVKRLKDSLPKEPSVEEQAREIEIQAFGGSSADSSPQAIYPDRTH